MAQTGNRSRRTKVSAAEKRRADLLEGAERRRVEIATELESSQQVLTRARAFTRKYDGVTVERAESQSFWNDLLSVFGIDRRAVGAEYERPARRRDTGGSGRIDVLWPGVLLAEHKSAGKDFDSAMAQADAYELAENDRPRLTMVCDFRRFRLRDNHTGRSTEFPLSTFPDNLGWFGPLVHDELTDLATQRPVDVQAAERMADLHDEIKAAGYVGHDLRVLMTRVLFCFFADDARIWPHGKFDSYMRSAPPAFAGAALAQLFTVLNTPPALRSTMIPESLKVFPYVNGGLFAENLPVSNLNEDLLETLIATSEDVDWAAVSPAVFGAMFQGVMDGVERHDLGAHYTSEENILRVIEPLFLDELYQEVEDAMTIPALERIWQRIATLRFLDPAAGCGNFLVVAYRELRRVERHLMAKIRDLAKLDTRYHQRYPWAVGQRYLDSSAATRLSVSQFYGIEIDEWPAKIAQVAMWLTDHLANMELEEQFGGQQTRLPLVDTAHINVGNALRLDWNELLGDNRADYVFGNPPFLGHKERDRSQNDDMALVWGKTKNSGALDYVSCWFKKAADYINTTTGRVAFVSTNSISQGEQPAVLWRYLYDHDMHTDFAHRPFSWTNEARVKAAVHVVITGFSQGKKSKKKPLWSYPDIYSTGVRSDVATINAYLVAGEEILVSNRRSPLSPGAQPMSFGSMANDDGNLIVKAADLEAVLNDPIAAKYLRRYVGSKEVINGLERYCLWLEEASPSDLRASRIIVERVNANRLYRESSRRLPTVALAGIPALFGEIRQPTSDYVALPRTSSRNRHYVPLLFLPADVIASDQLLTVDGGTPYTFGVLQSRVFQLWNATVSGRYKSDPRPSAEVTYNNFPWPDDQSKVSAVEAAVKEILQKRAAYPEATLADLYGYGSMPAELLKAHRDLDRVVLRQYGLRPSISDEDLLAVLFERYRLLRDSY